MENGIALSDVMDRCGAPAPNDRLRQRQKLRLPIVKGLIDELSGDIQRLGEGLKAMEDCKQLNGDDIGLATQKGILNDTRSRLEGLLQEKADLEAQLGISPL